MNRLLILLVTAAAATGCATIPQPLRGDFVPLVPVQASAEQRVGDVVRWGGRIVSVTPSPEHTCFEILGRELSDGARPVINADKSHGRFIACRAGFYDPEIFTNERDLTITGRIADFEIKRIGEYDYRYPRLDAEVIYLWPERKNEQRIIYQDPFGPGLYPGLRDYYPRVIITPAAPPAPKP